MDGERHVSGAYREWATIGRETGYQLKLIAMSFDDLKADLIKLYPDLAAASKTHLTEEDVQRWSVSLGVSRTVLYDNIAGYLARGFYNSELAFGFCDAIVNDIHAVITFADEERPDLFWNVFNAFDEGEYYHDGNREEDPVEVYTRSAPL